MTYGAIALDERNIARGVVRFRQLNDFLRSLRLPDVEFVYSDSQPSWKSLLAEAGIVEMFEVTGAPKDRIRRVRMLLIKEDRSYYEVRYPMEWFEDMKIEWSAFLQFPPDSRRVIIDALADMQSGSNAIRYREGPVDKFLEELAELRFREVLDESRIQAM